MYFLLALTFACSIGIAIQRRKMNLDELMARSIFNGMRYCYCILTLARFLCFATFASGGGGGVRPLAFRN